MKVIAITGGIGSGKSTVSAYLMNNGFEVVSADEISRSLTDKNEDMVRELATAFGNCILNRDGCIDRQGLADIVFADDEKKNTLEAIVTNKVIVEISKCIDKKRNEGNLDVLFIEAPLLFESGCDYLADEIWLVTAPEEDKIKRVTERDGINEDQVIARMENQLSDGVKALLSDRIIENDDGSEALYQQIDEVLDEERLE